MLKNVYTVEPRLYIIQLYSTHSVQYIKTLSEKDNGSRGLGFWDRGLSPAAGSRIHALHENYPWSSPSSRPLLRPASCAVTFVHTHTTRDLGIDMTVDS